MQKLLRFDPLKRISFPEIFKHPWFLGEMTLDESSIDIKENASEKEDVCNLKFTNLFFRKMSKKLSISDY